MPQRNRNRNNNQRRQQSNRMPSRTAAPTAPTTVQQPKPNYNPAVQEARYITDLNPVGSPEFNRWNDQLGGNYDGGGWVTWNKNKGPGDSGMLASDDDMRQFARANAYRESNNLGLMQRGGQESDAAKWDAQQAAQGQPTRTSPATKSYKDLKSIAGGLRIGGDNILGRREAGRIARGTGRSYDDVITKARELGMSIGGGAIKRSNKRWEQSGAGMLSQATGGLSGRDDPLADIRGLKLGKRQMFSGTYESDGQTMPLIESRRGGAASTLAGGGGRRGRRGKGKRGRGGGGVSDMGDIGGTTMEPTTTPMEPMTPEQMQEASKIEINMPGVSEDLSNWNTGYRPKRSNRRRLNIMSQGLAGQRINPTGSWSYRI